MTLGFYLTQFFYRVSRKHYPSFEGGYPVTDNVTQTTKEYKVDFVAKDKEHARNIIESYKNTHIQMMDKRSKGFGLFISVPESRMGKAKLVGGMATGLGNVRKNFNQGFSLGGVSPFAMVTTLVDTLYTAAKTKNKAKGKGEILSKQSLYSLFFIGTVLATLTLILLSFAYFKGHLTPVYLYIGLSIFAALIVFLLTTFKLIKNNHE